MLNAPFLKPRSFAEVAHDAINTQYRELHYLAKPRFEGRQIAVQIHKNNSVFIQDENGIFPIKNGCEISNLIAKYYRNLIGSRGVVAYGIYSNGIFHIEYARNIYTTSGMNDYNNAVDSNVDYILYNFDFGYFPIRRVRFIDDGYEAINYYVKWSSNDIFSIQKDLFSKAEKIKSKMITDSKIESLVFYPRYSATFDVANKLSFYI